MQPSEIIKLVNTALAGRDAAAVPCSELVDALPNDPKVQEVINAYRNMTADILLVALDRIANNRDVHRRKFAEADSLRDLGDTQLLFPTPDEPND